MGMAERALGTLIMTDTNSASVTPQPLSANPAPQSGPDNWLMMSLNRIDSSITGINVDIREIDRKLDGVDRKAESASNAINGLPDVSGHIRDTSVFIGRTEVRLDQLAQNSVTKGQIAVWVLGAVLTFLVGLAGAVWWLAEKYLVPIVDRLPPLQ